MLELPEPRAVVRDHFPGDRIEVNIASLEADVALAVVAAEPEAVLAEGHQFDLGS
jgi:hypothetical protein